MVAEIAFPYNVLQEIFVNLNFSVFAILATIISSIACIEFMKKEAKRSKEKENAIHQYVTVSKCCISALIVIFLILTFFGCNKIHKYTRYFLFYYIIFLF